MATQTYTNCIKLNFKNKLIEKKLAEANGIPTVNKIQLKATKYIFNPFLFLQLENPLKEILYKNTKILPIKAKPIIINEKVKSIPKETTKLTREINKILFGILSF